MDEWRRPVSGASVHCVLGPDRLLGEKETPLLGTTAVDGVFRWEPAPEQAEIDKFLCCCQGARYPFVLREDGIYEATITEPLVFGFSCRTIDGEPLENVRIAISQSELDSSPVLQLTTPNPAMPKEAVYTAASDAYGQARCVVVSEGAYALEAYKEGWLLTGFSPLEDRVHTEHRSIELAFVPAYAVAWQIPDDELLAYGIRSSGNTWSQGMMRDLKRQRLAVVRRLGRDVGVVILAPDGHAVPTFEGEFFLRHSGLVRRSGVAVRVTDLEAPLLMRAPQTYDHGCEVTVQVLDAAGALCPGITVTLSSGPNALARHHVLSGESICLPAGRYQAQLSAMFGLRTGRALTSIDAQPGGVATCVVRLLDETRTCRLSCWREGRAASGTERFRLTFDAGEKGTLCTNGDGWMEQTLALPTGMVRVKGTVGPWVVEQQEVTVTKGRPDAAPQEIRLELKPWVR